MTKRLATMLLVTMFLVGVSSRPARADDSQLSRATLKGISAVYVLVEDLDDDAKAMGLTKDAIQTDVELKLRLAGMQVVPPEDGVTLPYLYVRVTVSDRSARAAYTEVRLHQNALLQRNGQIAYGATTWDKSGLKIGPTAQGIRNEIKDHVDTFLNAWLSVNPKK